MPKAVVISSHIHGGGKAVEAGDVIHLDDKDFVWRCGIGLVKPYVEPPAPLETAPESVVIDTTTAEAPPVAEPEDGTVDTTSAEVPPVAEPKTQRRKSGTN